jgi:hypothetical protein
VISVAIKVVLDVSTINKETTINTENIRRDSGFLARVTDVESSRQKAPLMSLLSGPSCTGRLALSEPAVGAMASLDGAMMAAALYYPLVTLAL